MADLSWVVLGGRPPVTHKIMSHQRAREAEKANQYDPAEQPCLQDYWVNEHELK